MKWLFPPYPAITSIDSYTILLYSRLDCGLLCDWLASPKLKVASSITASPLRCSSLVVFKEVSFPPFLYLVDVQL